LGDALRFGATVVLGIAAVLFAAACAASLVGLLLIAADAAFAHEAPTGWVYGWECCSSGDCYQAAPTDVRETPQGYQLSTGEVIGYQDKRIKRSKDEYYHECKPQGDPKALRSICLYVPDRGL